MERNLTIDEKIYRGIDLNEEELEEYYIREAMKSLPPINSCPWPVWECVVFNPNSRLVSLADESIPSNHCSLKLKKVTFEKRWFQDCFENIHTGEKIYGYLYMKWVLTSLPKPDLLPVQKPESTIKEVSLRDYTVKAININMTVK